MTTGITIGKEKSHQMRFARGWIQWVILTQENTPWNSNTRKHIIRRMLWLIRRMKTTLRWSMEACTILLQQNRSTNIPMLSQEKISATPHSHSTRWLISNNCNDIQISLIKGLAHQGHKVVHQEQSFRLTDKTRYSTLRRLNSEYRMQPSTRITTSTGTIPRRTIDNLEHIKALNKRIRNWNFSEEKTNKLCIRELTFKFCTKSKLL